MKSGKAGFALIAVLWALVIVSALAAAYLAESRGVVVVSGNRTADLKAKYAAAAGVERVHNALERLQALSLDQATRLDVQSQARLTFVWNHLDSALVELGGECVAGACYEVRVRDLGTLLNVNQATDGQLRDLFRALGVDDRRSDIAAQSIADWIDGDDAHRARGAERDYYSVQRLDYGPRNGPILDITELRRIRGMSAELFERALPYLTLEGSGRINLNAAPGPVLAAVPGIGPATADVILDLRHRGIVFRDAFELSLYLAPQAQARLQAEFNRFRDVAAFEPRQIEVTSTGRYADSLLRVPIRAVFVRAGERVAQLRRSRLDL